jgi:hypothetical protein
MHHVAEGEIALVLIYKRFIMFSVITNMYNRKTKGPILMDLLTRVWQELEYRIDVCRVTRVAHIEHL